MSILSTRYEHIEYEVCGGGYRFWGEEEKGDGEQYRWVRRDVIRERGVTYLTKQAQHKE
jgi:hypothetical protein